MADAINYGTSGEVLGYGTLNSDGTVSFMSPVTTGQDGSVRIGGNGGNLVLKTNPIDPPSGFNWQSVSKWMMGDNGIIVPEYQLSMFNENMRVPFVIYPFKSDTSNEYVLRMHLPADSITNKSDIIPISNAPDGYIRIKDGGEYVCNVYEKTDHSLVAEVVRAGQESSLGTLVYSFGVANVIKTFQSVRVEQFTYGMVHFDDLLKQGGGGGVTQESGLKPFGVYVPDEESDAEGEGPGEDPFMYVPEGSLVVDSDVVSVERFGGGDFGERIPVEEGKSYWCVVRALAEGDAKYAAQIMTAEEMEDDDSPSVFRFEIAECEVGWNVRQFAYGTVHLGPLPDIGQMSVFQVASVDYEDESQEGARYRMFVPRGATLNYNGVNMDISNADGDWFDLSTDIGRVDGIVRYYCVVKNFNARIVDQKEFDEINVNAPNIQLALPVLAVKTGDGSWGPAQEFGSSDLGLIVTQEESQVFGKCYGCDADGSAWRSLFSRSKTVFQLRNEQTDKASVLGLVRKVSQEADGIAEIFFACHGEDGTGNLCLNKETLSPQELASALSGRAGDVWLVIDSCYSGKFANVARSSVSKFASEVVRLLAADGNGGGVLVWASASSNEKSWATSSGSVFTEACVRYIVGTTTFAEAWSQISEDASLIQWQHPVDSVSGFDTQRSILFGDDDSGESGGDDSGESGSDDPGESGDDEYRKRVSVRNFLFGMKHVMDTSTLSGGGGGVVLQQNKVFVAWNIYAMSDGVNSMKMMYLPENCLLCNGSFVPVDPPTGQRDGDWYDLGNATGSFFCNLFKDGDGKVTAKVSTQREPVSFFSFPVCDLAGGSGVVAGNQYASGIVSVSTTPPGPFEPVLHDGSVVGVEDGVVQIGGYTVEVGGTSSLGITSGYVCVEVSCTEGVPDTATIKTMADASELREAQKDLSKVCIPIYKLAEVPSPDGQSYVASVKMDLRRMPSAGMLEAFLEDNE